jgi:hypothetical protein
MSEPENFIARWSRRKREAEEAEAKSPAARAAAPASADPSEDRRKASDETPAGSAAPQRSEAAFDPSKLPPIETITAESDIRAFLAPGVPAELTRAALRRAWASDPKIRDFVGLSENAWDFNAPGAIAGFGPLEMTDELRAQIARMVGGSVAGATREAPSPSPRRQASPAEGASQSADAAAKASTQDVPSSAETPRNQAAGKSDEGGASQSLPHRNEAPVAPQPDAANSDNDQLIAKRPHGRALPT